MGIPLIIALNIIRITTVLAIGYNFGEDLALQIFHTVGATALMFIGTLILLAVTEKAFKKPKPTPPCPTCKPATTPSTGSICLDCGKLLKHPKTKLTKADITKIAGIAILVVMLLSIQAPVFALTQGPPQIISQTPTGTQVNTSNSLLPNVTGYTLNYVYRDTSFEKLSGGDADLVYSYSPTNTTKRTAWVAVQIAPSVSSEHRWETCLINFPLSQGSQTNVNQLDLRDIQLQANPPITARYFAFQYKNTNQTQVVLYWYTTATFNTNGTAQTKSVMMSIIMYPSTNQTVQDAEEQQLPIATAINNYWEPIKTWTAVALAISQNGIALSAAATILLALLIFYTLFLDRQEKRSLLTLYKKLPTQSQLVTTAIDNLKDAKDRSTSAVIDQYQKLSSTAASEAFIIDKLNEAQKAGLVKQTLTNKEDNPYISWKNQLPAKNKLHIL